VNIIIFYYRRNLKDQKKFWHSAPKISYLFKFTPESLKKLDGVGDKQVETFKQIVARLEVLREKKGGDK
jgi:hypothetical protein